MIKRAEEKLVFTFFFQRKHGLKLEVPAKEKFLHPELFNLNSIMLSNISSILFKQTLVHLLT